MATRAEVESALQAIDTATLRAVAQECGFSSRALFDYRKGHRPIPDAKLRPLARALGLLR